MVRIKKYYALAVEDKEASIYIFGDIVSWELFESDVSSYSLVKEIESLPEDIETINVFINSYGGEVAEGLAIYNVLRRHNAKVKTYCEGFACSAASMVFMAGDERIMPNTSLLWIHNAQWGEWGDYHALRKAADDTEKINEAAEQVYLNHVNISKDELKAMMDVETWLSPAEALEMGFATAVEDAGQSKRPTQNLRKQLMGMILGRQSKDRKLKVDVDLDGLADVLEARLKGLMAQGADPKSDPTPEPVPEPEPEPEPKPVENKPKNLMAALFAAEGD